MTVLDSDQVAIINEWVEYLELKVQKNYSGRGMYDKACFGFITNGSPIKLFGRILEYIIDEPISTHRDDQTALLSELMNDSAMDTMGMDMIIYFPSYTLPDD